MNQPQGKKLNGLLVAGFIIAIGILFTVLQVQQSLFQGQLSLPITYDDISYFVDSMRRLNRFYDQGLARLVIDFFQVPPHSVTSALTPLLGFSIFGSQDWAPAATNGIYVIAFLFFISHITLHLSWLYRVAIAGVAITCPLMGHLVIESRPDILCGLATACAAFLILQNPDFQKKRNHQILAGVTVSLALLAKPSISPITTIIVLSALLFSFFGGLYTYQHGLNAEIEKYKGLKKILAVLKQYQIFLVTTLFLCLPYYLVAIRRIVSYIYLNIFGADKELWQNQDSFTGQALYYITGPGGKAMFSSWGPIVFLVILLALLTAVLNRDWQRLRKISPYVGIISITYLLVTIPKTKSIFLGMAFGGMVLLSTLYLLIYSAEVLEKRSSSRINRILGRATCVALLTISLSTFQWTLFNKFGSPNTASVTQVVYEKQLIDSISQRMHDKLATATPQCAPQIAFTAEAPYLNGAVLEYKWRKQRITNFTMWTESRSNNLSEHWADIKQSDYVIAFSADNPTQMSWLPSNKIQRRLLRRLRSSPQFKLIDTFERPAPLGGGKVFLYESEQPCKFLPAATGKLY